MLIAHLERGMATIDRGLHLAESTEGWLHLDQIVESYHAFHQWLLEHESLAEDMMLVNSQREHFYSNGRKPV